MSIYSILIIKIELVPRRRRSLSSVGAENSLEILTFHERDKNMEILQM